MLDASPIASIAQSASAISSQVISTFVASTDSVLSLSGEEGGVGSALVRRRTRGFVLETLSFSYPRLRKRSRCPLGVHRDWPASPRLPMKLTDTGRQLPADADNCNSAHRRQVMRSCTAIWLETKLTSHVCSAVTLTCTWGTVASVSEKKSILILYSSI